MARVKERAPDPANDRLDLLPLRRAHELVKIDESTCFDSVGQVVFDGKGAVGAGWPEAMTRGSYPLLRSIRSRPVFDPGPDEA